MKTFPFSNFSWVEKDKIAASDFPYTEEHFKFLKSVGIRAIVTLTEEDVSKSLIEKYRFRHLHLPIDDFGVPSLSQVKKFLKWVKLMEVWEQPVLVHCRAGIGRTGTMLSVYYIWKGFSAEDSIKMVRNKRGSGVETLSQESFIYEVEELIPVIYPDKEEELFYVLLETMKVLRKECPWDRKQTRSSLMKYFIDEVEEVVKAEKEGDLDNFIEELGDVLLHIIFQCEIGRERDEFNITDVIDTLLKKLVRRHPHVFKDEVLRTDKDVEERWEEIKKREK